MVSGARQEKTRTAQVEKHPFSQLFAHKPRLNRVRLVSGRVAQESRARSLRFDVLQERLQGSRRLAALMDKEGAVKKELEAIMEKLQNRGCSLDTIGYCGAVGFTFQVHHSRLVKNF